MSEERDFEQEARQQGWVDKEEYKGDPEKWTDAQTFVEKGEKIAGIATKRAKEFEGLLAEAKETNKKLNDHYRKTLEKERRDHAQKVAEMEAKLAKAVTDGDGETFTRTNRELSQLREAAPEDPGAADKDAYNRLAQNWAAQNDWYGTNRKLTAFADGIAEQVVNEGYSGKAYFQELTRLVKEEFPEEFQNPKRSKANGVETGGERGGGSNKKSYENLPADAKRACDDFVKQGFMTREDYVAQYDWED